MRIQLSPALEQDLEHLATKTHTTVDDVAQRALEDYVAYRRDLNEAVRRADEDIAAGRVFTSEQVSARIDKLLTDR